MATTIEDLIAYGTKELEKENIEDAKLKVKILLAFLMNTPKEYLILHKEQILNNNVIKKYQQGINKIKSGMPLQHITHSQEFMGLSFYVDKNVLIPRFDTESLVIEILELIKNQENLNILDMCTGSGAIAISLAKKIKGCHIYAADISVKALKVAKINNQLNAANVEFIKSNMFKNISRKDFDIIVSNPPYIETTNIQYLNQDVQQEPKIALDGGEDGLKFYRILAKQAYQYLKPNGLLVMEIGYNQKQSVTKILKSTEKYQKINCKKDFDGNDRIILCKTLI